jgi:hypothetical protein
LRPSTTYEDVGELSKISIAFLKLTPAATESLTHEAKLVDADSPIPIRIPSTISANSKAENLNY